MSIERVLGVKNCQRDLTKPNAATHHADFHTAKGLTFFWGWLLFSFFFSVMHEKSKKKL